MSKRLVMTGSRGMGILGDAPLPGPAPFERRERARVPQTHDSTRSHAAVGGDRLPSHPMRAGGDVRSWWVATGHRRRLTREIVPRIAALRGVAIDVGGGRDAPHDRAWASSTRRGRLDVDPKHRPDLCGDAAALPFANGSVDAVTMFEVLEHLPDPAAAIDETRRVLVEGGTLLGSAPFVYPTHGDPGDYFRFGADGLRGLLRAFSDLELTPIGNATSSAWVLLSSSSRAWRVLNPALRTIGNRADPRCPEGWVFRATR